MLVYAKAIVAILGAAVTAALGIVPDQSVLFAVLTVVSAALTAAGVYAVPNRSPGDTPTVVDGELAG